MVDLRSLRLRDYGSSQTGGKTEIFSRLIRAMRTVFLHSFRKVGYPEAGSRKVWFSASSLLSVANSQYGVTGADALTVG